MAVTALAALHRKLFDETDGSKFARLKERLLKKHAADDRLAVLDILTAYARDGQLLHWRTFLMTDIVHLVEGSQHAAFFAWALEQPALAYWGIDGLLKSIGVDAYAPLVALAASGATRLEVRAKAIKSLAVFSRQPFDQDLPSDPGHWKAEQLRLSAVLAWQADGYPDGAGYKAPAKHETLAKPRSRLQVAAALLERKLALRRQREQDLAQPSNWLTMASAKDMAEIDAQWVLPEIYRHFLQFYSPLRVHVDGKRFPQGLHLYGAAELVEAQHGYAVHAVHNHNIASWQSKLVVIADAGGDPYCVHLEERSIDGDLPVYRARHGAGEWRFELHMDDFIDFLHEIAWAA
ncbi:SMI1/KNR4 family protein [Janthinobacterium sp. SUN100]|uniref:SMI1/KNR4 family protein n=1 Tax=Janthinobacterium sp. SUN100 TaxID=3004101 RepID=UPI0025B1643D|nr:SMI1/KNR4 family protein [Janthinobacterium sp. SUN100]MDN2701301.1 SMI1/KNR4 family protein [Janthinobacterium sp. SUN100]